VYRLLIQDIRQRSLLTNTNKRLQIVILSYMSMTRPVLNRDLLEAYPESSYIPRANSKLQTAMPYANMGERNCAL
jgi:hypothetical protein